MKKIIFYCYFLSAFIHLNAQNPINLIISENDSMRIEIQLLKAINSEFNDYAPVITADGEQLFFTSRRPYTDKEQSKNKEGKENIYYSLYDSDTKKWRKRC